MAGGANGEEGEEGEEDAGEEDAAAAVVIKRSCSWIALSGCIDNVVDVILNPAGGSSPSSSADTALVLSRSTSSAPCEISVEFQQRLCHVRSISVLSSARTCEVYSQRLPNGEAEYIVTARGELLAGGNSGSEDAGEGCGQSDATVADQVAHRSRFPHCTGLRSLFDDSQLSGEPLYETEVELVNSDAWAGIKVRLLSLRDKALACVKKVVVLAVVGAPAAVVQQEAESSNGANASFLAMLMPSVLQMVRNVSENGERAGNASRSTVLAKGDTSSSGNGTPVSQVVTEGTSSQPRSSSSQREDGNNDNFQNEIRYRLQNLEMVCSRMESYVHLGFTKLDEKISHLQQQVETMQGHPLFAGFPETPPYAEPVIVQEVPQPPSQGQEMRQVEGDVQPLEEASQERESDSVCGDDESAASSFERDDSDLASEEEEQQEGDDGEAVEEDEDDEDEVVAAEVTQRAYVTLDDAWTSALAAFSASTTRLHQTAGEDVNECDRRQLMSVEATIGFVSESWSNSSSSGTRDNNPLEGKKSSVSDVGGSCSSVGASEANDRAEPEVDEEVGLQRSSLDEAFHDAQLVVEGMTDAVVAAPAELKAGFIEACSFTIREADADPLLIDCIGGDDLVKQQQQQTSSLNLTAEEVSDMALLVEVTGSGEGLQPAAVVAPVTGEDCADLLSL